MHASPNVIQAAELRRRDFVAQSQRERQIDAALAAVGASRSLATAPRRAATAPRHAALALGPSPRSLLTSLAGTPSRPSHALRRRHPALATRNGVG
jgi:hypothetical protein